MTTTATTPSELLTVIDSTIRNQTAPNSITPITHANLLYGMVEVLSGSTFTGNTSGDCIPDIYVSNIHSCSPINFFEGQLKIAEFNSTDGFVLEPNVPIKLGEGSNILDYNGKQIISEDGTTQKYNSDVYGESKFYDSFTENLTYRTEYTGTTTGGTVFKHVNQQTPIDPEKPNLFRHINELRPTDLEGNELNSYNITEGFDMVDSLLYSKNISGTSTGVTGTTVFADTYDFVSGSYSTSFNNGLVDYKVTKGPCSGLGPNDPCDPEAGKNAYVETYRDASLDDGLLSIKGINFASGRISNTKKWADVDGNDLNCDFHYSNSEYSRTGLTRTDVISGTSSGVTGTTVFADKYDFVNGVITTSFNNGLVDYKVTEGYKPCGDPNDPCDPEAGSPFVRSISGSSTGVTGTTVFEHVYDLIGGSYSTYVNDNKIAEINSSGFSATTYYGDGSNLTGVALLSNQPLRYKCLLSQNAPEFDMAISTMIAGQIWELSDVAAHPSSQAFLDTLELVSGTLYALGSKYRAAIDTPFSIPETIMTYDGSPYIVSKNANGDFAPFVNTLGEIFFIYGATGQFAATSVGLFIQGKTYVNHKSYVIGGVGSGIFTSYRYDDDNIAIYTNLVGGVSADGRLSYEPFEIEVYP